MGNLHIYALSNFMKKLYERINDLTNVKEIKKKSGKYIGKLNKNFMKMIRYNCFGKHQTEAGFLN